MRKKLPFIILAIIIFVQICVPVGLIIYHKIDSTLAETKGEKFRFHIDYLSYSIEGKLFFDVDTKTQWMWEHIYADIEIDEEGYAIFNLSKEKPDSNYYIKSSQPKEFYFPVTDIKTDTYDHLYSMTFNKDYSDYDYYTPLGYYKEAYLEAYVYKGRVGAPKIYIDGMEAEEFLSNLNETIKQNKININ